MRIVYCRIPPTSRYDPISAHSKFFGVIAYKDGNSILLS